MMFDQRLAQDLLRAPSAKIVRPVWYIAGPLEYVKNWGELLGAIGVDKEDIRAEILRDAGSLGHQYCPAVFPILVCVPARKAEF
jgi:hypothetical protein